MFKTEIIHSHNDLDEQREPDKINLTTHCGVYNHFIQTLKLKLMLF